MFCPSCGKEIPDQSKFCLVCGKSIPVVAAPVEQPRGAVVKEELSPKKEWGPLKSISVTFLVVLCVWLVVMIVYHQVFPVHSAAQSGEAEEFREFQKGLHPTYVPRIEKLT